MGLVLELSSGSPERVCRRVVLVVSVILVVVLWARRGRTSACQLWKGGARWTTAMVRAEMIVAEMIVVSIKLPLESMAASVTA